MTESVKAKVSVMGQIDTREPDDSTTSVPFGLLLQFESPEELRQALKDGRVEFSLGD